MDRLDLICAQNPPLLPSPYNHPNPVNNEFSSAAFIPFMPRARTWGPLRNRCKPIVTFPPSLPASSTNVNFLFSASRVVNRTTLNPATSPSSICLRVQALTSHSRWGTPRTSSSMKRPSVLMRRIRPSSEKRARGGWAGGWFVLCWLRARSCFRCTPRWRSRRICISGVRMVRRRVCTRIRSRGRILGWWWGFWSSRSLVSFSLASFSRAKRSRAMRSLASRSRCSFSRARACSHFSFSALAFAAFSASSRSFCASSRFFLSSSARLRSSSRFRRALAQVLAPALIWAAAVVRVWVVAVDLVLSVEVEAAADMKLAVQAVVLVQVEEVPNSSPAARIRPASNTHANHQQQHAHSSAGHELSRPLLQHRHDQRPNADCQQRACYT
ncbi:hypothetical protein KC325_g2 [Hortaea werneckii]|nr:hypothetical protein KC325_g2 [Hortaea werneckii]